MESIQRSSIFLPGIPEEPASDIRHQKVLQYCSSLPPVSETPDVLLNEEGMKIDEDEVEENTNHRSRTHSESQSQIVSR